MLHDHLNVFNNYTRLDIFFHIKTWGLGLDLGEIILEETNGACFHIGPLTICYGLNKSFSEE